MNIRSIRMLRFASHAATEVELPARGLVVVQGPNGAGKSALVEAVVAACWGKSLRGSALWLEAEAGHVGIESDVASVHRKRSAKGKGSLTWGARDPADLAALRLRNEPLGGDDFENNTKAQERLESLIGTFEVWKRTSVLSSSDAAHFALATDAERKLLLEQVLGLDRFDAAHSACRSDLRNAIAERNILQRDLEVARARLDGARAAWASADSILQSLELPDDEDELQAKILHVKQAKLDSAALVGEARDRLRKLDRSVAEATGHRAAARREADLIRARMSDKTCTKCGQSIAHKNANAQAELDDAERRAALPGPANDTAALEDEVAELDGEYSSIAAKVLVLEQRLARCSRSHLAREQALKAANKASLDLADWTQSHSMAVDMLAGQSCNVEVLEACELVLGMRGVRATMLDRALGAIQQQANAWLKRLAFPGSIELSSTTEQKSGKVVDAISLDVAGAGGGKYRGSSGGERRRIDVALLLGLAEVAAAARGGRKGTLFCDELFDALDTEGVHAAADALVDLAKDRTIVVITHSEELAARLPAALRLRVEAGTVIQS